MILGAFLGVFALAGVAILPNQAHAQNRWENPNADANLIWNWEQELTWAAFLDTVNNAINWILWMLATVALVICLYGGFLMVTAAGDAKKYEKGLEVLKYAGIGLAIIGLSWMIVSVIFWFVGNLSWDNQTGSQWVESVNNEKGWSIRGNNGGNGEVQPK